MNIHIFLTVKLQKKRKHRQSFEESDTFCKEAIKLAAFTKLVISLWFVDEEMKQVIIYVCFQVSDNGILQIFSNFFNIYM